MSELAPGILVECIGHFEPWRDVAARLGVAVPYRGIVYTVRDIEDYQGSVWVRLEEIRNPVVNGHLRECAFDGDAFRPVGRPDISALRAMLASDVERVSA